FSPDGRWVLFTTNITERNQLWRVPVEGGWPEPVTTGDETVYSGDWSPDGTLIAFEHDYGGNERYDLFLMPATGGRPQNLTSTPGVREQLAGGWSDDGRYLAFISDSGRLGHFELWLHDASAHTARPVTSNAVSTFGAVWSHDARSLALLRTDDFSTVDLVLADVASRAERLLTPHTEGRAWTAVAFSPDDRSVLVRSDARDGVPRLAVVSTAGGEPTWLETGAWEIVAAGWSRTGEIAYSENADGRVTTWVMRPDGSRRRRIGPATGVTTFQKFSRDGRLALLLHADAQHAFDVWVHDLTRDTAWQVTNSMVGGLDPDALAPADLIHYSTFDGRRISAFVLMPFNLRRDGSNPAIVMPHGGPSGQWLDWFNSSAAYYANHGYIVILPNVRGSTGYGKEFEDLNNRDWGGGDLRDLLAGADSLVSTGYVSRDRIGIIGGSYGGYLTLAALAFAPDRWAAGVDLFGVSSIVTLARTTDPLLGPYLAREMGTLPADEGLMSERSPLSRASDIRAPLLILQGANDPRVPVTESRQISEVVRRRGGIAELVLYPGEGHGFAKRENQLDSERRAIAWFDRYLRPASVRGP
ncbi:MAG: S9 family peptidase, partial [Candidatus Methylomirabilaceae bacterium]